MKHHHRGFCRRLLVEVVNLERCEKVGENVLQDSRRHGRFLAIALDPCLVPAGIVHRTPGQFE
jgi:hypothetical protein